MAASEPAAPSAVSSRGIDARFSAAAESTGVFEQPLLIAGLPIRLRFAGRPMLDLLGRSFTHLAAENLGDDADVLTVDIWDTLTSGVPGPPTLGEPLSPDGIGPFYYFEEGGVRALSRWETLSVLDFESRRAWFWAQDTGRMRSWDWASPLRAILHWWLGYHGLLQVHGGAVGTADGGVMVVGRGGSGKSTTTLACLSSGLRYAGDDFVGLAGEPEPWVHSLYGSGKLEPHHLAVFPALQRWVSNPVRDADDKVIVFAQEAAPGVPIRGFPLRAVLVPRVVAQEPESRLKPISPAAALAALAPSTVFQLHPPQPDGLAKMAQLVARVPCLSLELGSDINRIPDPIHRLLGSET